VPAVVPSAPAQPTYSSSNDDQIVLDFYRSTDDGGLPILDYELHMDDGALGSFNKVSNYVFSSDGFQYAI
jgi:hypothetical protein